MFSSVTIVNSRLVIREAELEGLTRTRVVEEAELISEAEEPGECQYLPRLRQGDTLQLMRRNRNLV